MEQGYKKIFWGFLITLFNINIGLINILPDFWGYFVIGSGLIKIINEFDSKNFKTANKIANLLFVYTLFIYILNIIGFSEMIIGYSSEYQYKNILDIGLSIIVSSVKLLMTFHIFSGTVDLYLSKEQKNYSDLLVNSQRNYTVLLIMGLILISISINISNEIYTGFTAVYLIIVQIYFVILISGVKKNLDII